MRSLHPPVVPTWLLEHVHVDEALAGDLAEQYRNGGSTVWYWRQALAATVVLSVQPIVAHKWLAARAILTGWLVWAILAAILRESHAWVAAQDADAMSWIASALAFVKATMWLPIGWVIGRLHRPHQMAMVLAYVGFTLVMSTPVVARAAIELLGHPEYSPPSVTTVFVAVFSLIAGALLSAPRVRQPRPERIGASP